MRGYNDQPMFFTQQDYLSAKLERLMSSAVKEEEEKKKEEEEIMDVVVEIEVQPDHEMQRDPQMVLWDEFERVYHLAIMREQEKDLWKNNALASDRALMAERQAHVEEVRRLRNLLIGVTRDANEDVNALVQEVGVLRKRLREVTALIDEPRAVRPAKANARRSMQKDYQDGLSE